MYADKLKYRTIGLGGGSISVLPIGFFGLIALSDIGSIKVTDGPVSTGDLLYEGPMTKGQVVHFGGLGFAAKRGLFFSMAGVTGSKANIIYG